MCTRSSSSPQTISVPTGTRASLGAWAWSTVLVSVGLVACSSTPEEPGQDHRKELWDQVSRDSRGREVESDQVPPAEAGANALSDDNPLDQDIGLFLRGLDARMRAWNQRVLIATGPREVSERYGLEEDIRHRVQLRLLEVIGQLQLGPVNNRRIAAAALGFSDSDAALGPLIAALSDRDIEVISNALVGLGQLARPETSLGPILNLLEIGYDPWLRSNAAYALKRLVEAGARDDRVALVCRRALLDTEPGVRVQCSAVLGNLVDIDSIDALAGLLHDDVALVALAGARALAHIGSADLHEKGRCARHLADALASAPSPLHDYLLAEMSTMSQVDYGKDAFRWREWAYKMD